MIRRMLLLVVLAVGATAAAATVASRDEIERYLKMRQM